MITLVHRILLGLLATVAATCALAGEPRFPYSIQKGEISVFGYRLRSNEIVSSVKDEYYVSFVESPNKQFVLVIYDIPFEKQAVWLYDKSTKASPQPIKTKRPGRHFGAEWYGSRVFALFGAGMGYKTSKLFKVEDLNHYKKLDDIVTYDPERDIYARLDSDKQFNYFIFVGRAFHDGSKEEQFPIALYNQDMTGAVTYVKNLVIGANGITVTYQNEDGKTVTQSFRSNIAEQAKPGD